MHRSIRFERENKYDTNTNYFTKKLFLSKEWTMILNIDRCNGSTSTRIHACLSLRRVCRSKTFPFLFRFDEITSLSGCFIPDDIYEKKKTGKRETLPIRS